MKKIIIISLLTVSLAATSFGQGWLTLSSVRSQAWDNFTTPGVATITSHLDVCLYWAAGANAANPASLANTPTSGNPTITATDWSNILNSTNSGWTLAQDNNAGNANVIVSTSTRGAVIYSLGAGWSLNGSVAGGTISLLEVAWNGIYSTPTAAAAANSALGWSYLNTYTLATSSVDSSIGNPTFTAYGVFPVPEPTTMALAGLGGMALLMFRRRK